MSRFLQGGHLGSLFRIKSLTIRNSCVIDGFIVLARIDDDVAVVKRIRCFPAKLVLESINPEYQDRIFERDDMNRVHIEGVVRRIVKPV